MEHITAKTIISKSKSKVWFGCDYIMNIYRGCNHGCIYCDSRSECYHVDNFDQIRAKANANNIIAKELKSKRIKGVVATGAMSDPYNAFEKETQYTRGALKLIDQNQFGIAIATKSNLVTRDIDIIKSIARHSPVIVKMTITTFDDSLCKVLEPNVASTSERFDALRQLSDNGIFCGILLMPILPFINDNEENILNIVRKAKECNVKFIYGAFGVTLRTNQRDHYFEKLDILFPGLKQFYLKQYGHQYSCASPNAKKLYECFTKACQKYGILYKMSDIVHAYQKNYQEEPLTLF